MRTAAQRKGQYGCPSRVTYRNILERIKSHPAAAGTDLEGAEVVGRLTMVPCPKCRVSPGRWCRRPDGLFYDFLHVARWRAAYRAGVWESPTVELPGVEELWS